MDLEALCEELGLDRDQFAQFASLFLDVAFTELDRMKEAADREDLADIAQAAHSIKGAALTLELERISGIARALESDAKVGAKDKIPSGMESLLQEMEKLRKCFQEQGLFEEKAAPQVEP